MPGAVTIFVKAPSFAELERRLRERASESAGEIEKRLEVAREQLSHEDEFDHVIVNDDLDRAAHELDGVVREAQFAAAGSMRPRDLSTHRPAARQRRLALRAGDRRGQAGPADQQLPPPARRGHVRRVPPPLVQSRSKNYLTMALEEIAEGKIEYTYKG